ncbi:HGGxSTG domain-containing protein [Falsigemmobacter intermedius]
MTGDDLAKIRKAAGLSQTKLAELSGVGRHAISYWENRRTVKRSAHAIVAIASVLDLPDTSAVKCARAVWGVRMRARIAAENRAIELSLQRLKAQYAVAADQRRVRCNAKTRKGTHCWCSSAPGKQRCKYHGGLSTGARTEEGRERIAQAQRRRWARWRAEKLTDNPNA